MVNYTHYILDRISEICYTDTNENQKIYKYTYTSDGKIHTVEDSASNVGYMYSYNSDGKMSGYIEYKLNSNENVIGIEYIYNEQSLIEHVNTFFTFATSNGTALDVILSHYDYNDDKSLKTLEIDTAGSNYNTYKISYSYDKFNRLSGKTATYGSLTYETDYIYRNLNSTRTSSQVSMYSTYLNDIETSYSYTYDVNGNITQIRDDDDKVTQYKYDDQGQLIREDNPYFNKSYVYTYDNAGNRTSKKTYAYTTGTLGSVTSTETYSYSDESWGDRLTAVGSQSVTYDEIGNPLKYEGYVYEWQNGRQLSKLSNVTRATVSSYTYNADGIRTSKTVNGVKHTYTLNGSQIVSEEWKVGSTTHTLVYLYDESGSPIGLQYRPSSMVKEIFYTYFFEKNMHGDITAIFKDNGVKIGTYTYDAWGNVKTTVNSSATTLEKNIVQSYNPFRYRGYYYDTESGLYYLQSRYYNPQWGRFLNADGYINANGDIIGYNLYVYCSNNPVMYIDPTGYIAIIDDILIFTTITVVVVVALNLPKIYNTIMSVVYGILAIVDTVTEAFSKIIPDSSNSDDLERPTDESGKIIVTPGDPPRESDGYRAPKHGPEKGKTKSGKRGWKDKNGNIWIPVPTGTQSAHGGGHWDVTLPDESGYINVYPGGKTRAGRGKTPIFNK